MPHADACNPYSGYGNSIPTAGINHPISGTCCSTNKQFPPLCNARGMQSGRVDHAVYCRQNRDLSEYESGNERAWLIDRSSQSNKIEIIRSESASRHPQTQDMLLLKKYNEKFGLNLAIAECVFFTTPIVPLNRGFSKRFDSRQDVQLLLFCPEIAT